MISVRLSDTLVPVCAIGVERVRRFFDLQAERRPLMPRLARWRRGGPDFGFPEVFTDLNWPFAPFLGSKFPWLLREHWPAGWWHVSAPRFRRRLPHWVFFFRRHPKLPVLQPRRLSNWESSAAGPKPSLPWLKLFIGVICPWSRATGSRELCGSFVTYPASVNGRRNILPCARFPGRTLFRTPIWASARRWEEAVPNKFWNWPKNGGHGALTPLCTFGRHWRKNDDRDFIKTNKNNELSL